MQKNQTPNIEELIVENRNLKKMLQQENLKNQALDLKLMYSQEMMEADSKGALIMTETFVECNSKACEIWKTQRDDIIGKSPADFAPLYQPNGEKSYDMAQRKIQSALAGNPQRFLWKDKLPDGLIIDTEVFLRPVTLNGKQHIAASIKDVTKAKLKEKNQFDLIQKVVLILEKKENSQKDIHILKDRFETVEDEIQEIFDSAEEGMVLLDNNKNILITNSAYFRLTGICRQKHLHKKCYDLFPCKGCENGTHCRSEQLLQNNDQSEFETECINDKGKIIPCIVLARTIKNSYGQKLGTIQSFKDLSSYKSGVDRLKASEEMHRVILSSITDAVFITNDDGNFFFISPSVKNIFGYDLEEIWWMDNIEKLLGKGFFSLKQLNKNKQLKNIEIIVADKFGQEHFIDVTVKKVDIGGGNILISCHDITLEKIRTRQLEQAGKMATLGILVAGMGHEINNPNQFIGLNTPILARIWKDTQKILEKKYTSHGDFFLGGIKYSLAREKIPGLFDGIIQGSKRIKSIVADLKNYSRKNAARQDNKVFINSVVKHSLTLISNLVKKNTNNFTITYSNKKPTIKGNFQQIEQVIINLVQNACEALTNNKQSIHIITDINQKTKFVVIEIKDQGVGIKSADIHHITDPFFTTKRGCGGTGLGLSISEKIIVEHRGKLLFASEPNCGTKVTILLPQFS